MTLGSTRSEAQQTLAKLRERQGEQGTTETKTAPAVQHKVAQLREPQAQQEAAEQRVASLRAYQAALQAKITNAWKIPPQSKSLHAEVFLIIDRTGNVEQSRLVQGSGDALFDESLQQAIKQAQPLPALPEDYAAPSVRVTLHFRGRG